MSGDFKNNCFGFCLIPDSETVCWTDENVFGAGFCLKCLNDTKGEFTIPNMKFYTLEEK